MMQQKSFKWIVAFAGLTIVFAVIMSFNMHNVLPPNPLNYQPVLAFEFAKTPADIKRLFVKGNSNVDIDFVSRMRCATWIDFLFIVSYTLFMVSFIRFLRKGKYLKLNSILLILAVLIGVFDVLENIQLLRILKEVSVNTESSFKPELNQLQIFTWLKWEGTAVLLVLMIPFLWPRDIWLKIIALVNIVVAGYGVNALVTNWCSDCPSSITQFTRMIFLTLFLFIIYSFVSLAVELWRRKQSRIS